MTQGELPVLVTFWHGQLSWLERLCLTSFVRQGHRVELYSYEPVDGLPDGVVRRDAAEVVSRERLVFYKGNGTPGVFSDLFRMTILKQGRGVWIDADVYCLKPIAGPPPYLFAYEREGSINGAVLHIPHDSALLDDLLAIFDPDRRRLMEPHLMPLRRIALAAKRLLGIHVPPHYMQYGSTGPAALTYHARQRGLIGHALPAEVFYPIPYEKIPALMKTGGLLDAAVTARTLGVHIWRSQLTRRGRAEMPLPAPDSTLAELCRRDGIALA